MRDSSLLVRRVADARIQVEELPDGTTAVFDTGTQTVHSLDRTASAVFRGCGESAGFEELVRAARADESAVAKAVSELEAAGLVTCSEPVGASATRRALLRAAGIAIPSVLSLTALEQRAYAIQAISGPTTTTTTTTTAAPLSLSFSPSDPQSCGVQVLINGTGTHFDASSVVSSPTPGVTFSNQTLNSPTQISVIFDATTLGPATITVTTGSEVASGTVTVRLCA